ncbi:MAG: hypothetical protein M3O03_12225 [Pseudomonadota bacterium]|nr:hypothetical protein [Pseudomonadota bacterium]
MTALLLALGMPALMTLAVMWIIRREDRAVEAHFAPEAEISPHYTTTLNHGDVAMTIGE